MKSRKIESERKKSTDRLVVFNFFYIFIVFCLELMLYYGSKPMLNCIKLLFASTSIVFDRVIIALTYTNFLDFTFFV